MNDFVDRNSVVRRIWGNGDMVLMVFAASAAEFALNRAVDWLFFTGELPRDPIGRLFRTAAYSQQIVFADAATATRTLERIRLVHEAVERERGQRIPDWAHRDVLYMLIDHSERAHELLARPLTSAEQRDLYDVFRRVGVGLGIPDLPHTYEDWRVDRELHLHRDLACGEGTRALYRQYRRHLGWWRYRLLLRLQAMLVPAHARTLLQLRSADALRPLARCYPLLVRAGLRPLVQWLLMPAAYLDAVRELDRAAPAHRSNAVRKREGRMVGFARRLARSSLLALALCSSGATRAAAQKLPADWSVYLGVGASRIDTGELHERLDESGFPAFDRTAAGINLGAWTTLRSGVMLGGEWHFLPVGDEIHEGRAFGLGAGYGTLGIGYAVELSPRIRIYPRIGIGAGGFGLWMETETDTIAFDDVLANPDARPRHRDDGFLTLSRDNMVIDIGAGGELRRSGAGFGALLGVRFGYVLAPFTTGWHVQGRELSDGPAATVAGPYVRMTFGAGRRRR